MFVVKIMYKRTQRQTTVESTLVSVLQYPLCDKYISSLILNTDATKCTWFFHEA